MRAGKPAARQGGFTLLEIIVGLAISSLILVSLNMVMATINRAMDATTQSVGRQSAITSALQVAAGDLSRIELYRDNARPPGRYLFEGRSRGLVFALSERPGNNQAGTYWVRFLVRGIEGGSELVRMRMPLVPGTTDTAAGTWADEVILVSAPVDIQFSYRAPRNGLRSWASDWATAAMMPEQVRITVTDIATGRLRVPQFVETLKIEADLACVVPKSPDCGLAGREASEQ